MIKKWINKLEKDTKKSEFTEDCNNKIKIVMVAGILGSMAALIFCFFYFNQF